MTCPRSVTRSKAVWGPKRALAVAALLVFGFVPNPMAAGGPGPKAAPPAKARHKLDKALDEARDAGATSHKVIVTVRQGCLPAAVDSLTRHGARIKARHDSIQAISAEVTDANLADLQADDCVQSVSTDALVKAHGTGRGEGLDPNIPVADAPALRQTLGLAATAGGRGAINGTEFGVAVIDSGIAPGKDVSGGRIWGFYDFTNGQIPADPSQGATPSDDYGHGTHVAGLIGASGGASSNQFQGVAPAVGLIGLKVLDGNGQGSTSDVIAALQFITKYHVQLWTQVVNLSLGHPIYESAATDPLVQAVEAAVRSGLVVLVSAGNDGWNSNTQTSGYGGIASPGNAPSAITVGAVNTNNTATRGDE